MMMVVLTCIMTGNLSLSIAMLAPKEGGPPLFLLAVINMLAPGAWPASERRLAGGGRCSVVVLPWCCCGGGGGCSEQATDGCNHRDVHSQCHHTNHKAAILPTALAIESSTSHAEQNDMIHCYHIHDTAVGTL